MIRYEISLFSPEAHLFQVKMHLAEPDHVAQTFYLPAWIRGSYMIRDFSRHIIRLSAEQAGNNVEIIKTDKQTWQLAPCAGPVTLTYIVYGWDLSVRGAHLDTTHAYFNGPCVFLAATGREPQPCSVQVIAPSHKNFERWTVATSMVPKEIDNRGYGVYTVSDYETLMDHPVEISEMAGAEFSVNGISHRFMVSGRHSADLSRLTQDMAKICGVHAELFSELPVDHYLFLLWVVGEGYGGLEHRDSTSLMCSRDDLPHSQMTDITEGYRRLLGLCSHEYFHLWNVKRIMPAVFQGASTQYEVYTRQLWVFEGVTSYYDDLAMLRSGVIDKQSYFQLLAETITRVMRGTGRKKQTLEESSFDAWTKFYKQDENSPNAIVSYYAKGALLALALDLHIRINTQNAKSLDTIMRHVWQHYGKTGQGLDEGEFERIAAEVSGLDLRAFFDLGARSTQDLPLIELLREMGVEMTLMPARTSADKGWVTKEPPQAVTAKPVLGAAIAMENLQLKLTQVFDDGAAQLAGLSAGDIIIAINGLRVTDKQLEQRVANCPVGESIKVHAFRRDELMEFEVVPKPAPADTCVFYLPQDISARQSSMQNAWLRLDGNQI